MHVIGTAGHVDHGKSTFLNALTGMSPDRLPEEKSRGMTIDLNFVWLELAGKKLGIVDVPGHHRFVKNMVSGAMSLDAFIFLVAADDGWMPQSEEHLNVLRLLGISQGLIVVSKCDLVDTPTVQGVKKDLDERFQKILKREFPILEFSGPQTDMTLIRSALEELVDGLKPPGTEKGARLWVDRVFHPKGMGTVVTGTLREGTVKVGDELWVAAKQKVLVKSIQAYHEELSEVGPVSRVALQLGRVEADALSRGSLLQSKSTDPSFIVDAWVQIFEEGFEIKKNKHLSLHIGTRREDAFVIPMQEPKATADAFFVRIKFEVPVVLRSGERFLLRTAGDERTLGGGVVCDSSPRFRSHKQSVEYLKSWRSGLGGAVAFEIKKMGFIDLTQFERTSVWPLSQIHEVVNGPSYAHVGTGTYSDAVWWRQTVAKLVKVIETAHSHGLEWVNASKMAELGRNNWKVHPQATPKLLDFAVQSGKLVCEAGQYQSVAFQKALEPWEKDAIDLIERGIKRDGGKPISIKELGGTFSVLQKTVAIHEKRMGIVRLGSEYIVRKVNYDEACTAVVDFLKAKGEGTTSELRQHLGLSRKPTVLLLERMDADRITYLKDGVRKLL